jgi:hypothetical protein
MQAARTPTLSPQPAPQATGNPAQKTHKWQICIHRKHWQPNTATDK